MESMPARPAKRSSFAIVAVALVAGRAVGAVLMLRGKHDDTRAPADTTTTAPRATATAPRATASETTAATATTNATSATLAATTGASASETAPAKMVMVRIEVTPKTATVYRDDLALGPAPGPFSLPLGADPITLRITAPGFASKTIDVVPKEGLVTKVALVPDVKPKTPKPISTDLESPF
jgi:hypothetical protein